MSKIPVTAIVTGKIINGTDVHKGFNNNAGAYNHIHQNAHFQKVLFCGTMYLQRRILL